VEVELFDGRHGAREQPDGDAETARRVEHVDPDPDVADRHGHVDGPAAPEGLQLPDREDLLDDPVDLAVGPAARRVEVDLAVLAVDDRMPTGDVHIGTAFLDGCHNDLAELIHPFFPPRIRVESAMWNPLEDERLEKGSTAHGSGGGIISTKHAMHPAGM